MEVDVIIEDRRWTEAGLEALAAHGVGAVLAHLGLDDRNCEIAVLGCDDARIAVLNSEFRGKAQATNVLSWPSEERGAEVAGARPELPEGDGELGDIAIAFETCAREAEAAGRPMPDHVLHLVVHGTLHLLGYDHERAADGDLMEAIETAILAQLGVPDPYGETGRTGFIDDGKD